MISEKLKKLRADKGITQEVAAREIGISRTALESYETGRRVPKDAIKVKIANYYNADLVEIFFTT